MIDVLREAYRGQPDLPELLVALVRALSRRIPDCQLTLTLSDWGQLTATGSGDKLAHRWAPARRSLQPRTGRPSDIAEGEPARNGLRRAGGGAGSGDEPPGPFPHLPSESGTTTLSVDYAGRAIGALRLAWAAPATLGADDRTLCQAFARRCALLVARFHVRNWIQDRLARPLLLTGSSTALLELELFVEQAAQSSLPVTLTGEFGTEKALIAAAIHCSGPAAAGPFIEVSGPEPEGTPTEWSEQARGGTLFFNGIDEFSPTWQRRLARCLPSRLGQWLTPPESQEVRIIASTTLDLRQRVSEGGFSRPLLAELDFLSAAVPPLRDRGDDLDHLIASILERNGARIGASDLGRLVDTYRGHSWPENLYELEHVLARLTIFGDRTPFGGADLRRHASHAAPMLGTRPASEDSGIVEKSDIATLTPEHWVRCAIARRASDLDGLHDGLRKALLYLGKHYAEAIPFQQLAQESHVSPSHLRFLFRTILGTTFKELLQRIRVEMAKDSIQRGVHNRITDVAQSVGYGDLSHFERSFRRFVGQSPRDYRRANTACPVRNAS